ncbi:MAG TPA: prepilin-type N-terminal cleavage/methylation domain-containing protein [Candidatus Binataceae bacterium]|nr:prepilin-type N-terminal cleavage/methylation domain-containing protein [Candidatus Binataceae bacterium]
MPTKRPLKVNSEPGIAACGGRVRRLARLVRGAQSGFTLLEIAIVLFIMGLMMSIALPYFGGLTGTRLKSEARQLAGRATYLYDAATTQKLVMRLNFDLDTNSYFVTQLDPYSPAPTFQLEQGFLGRVMLPPGIRLRDVTVGTLGTVTRGVVGCAFYPTGWADATVIHLAASDGDVFTLAINPLIGQVSIISGDLSPRQAAINGQ